MSNAVLFDLDHNRSRLEYYRRLKGSAKGTAAIDKWIEIYADRVTKLEKQMQKMQKLGLKVELSMDKSARQARA